MARALARKNGFSLEHYTENGGIDARVANDVRYEARALLDRIVPMLSPPMDADVAGPVGRLRNTGDGSTDIVLSKAAALIQAQAAELARLREAELRHLAALGQQAEALEKAVMAEREACSAMVHAAATAIEDEERDNATWGGPDPRGSNARGIALDYAKRLRELAKSLRARSAP